MWASVLLVFLKTILSSNDQKKLVSLTPKETLSGLSEYIDLDQIPQDFGGTSPVVLGQSEEERELYEAVRRANSQSGVSIIRVPPDNAASASGWLPKAPVGFQDD